MALTKKDLRTYFKRKETENEQNPSSKMVQLSSPEIIVPATENVSRVEIEFTKEEIKASVRPEQYTPEKKKKVAKYMIMHGTKAVVDRFSKLYPKYTFLIIFNLVR